MDLWKSMLLTVYISGMFAGCAENDSGMPEPDDELSSATGQELVLWRNDQNGIIVPSAGLWGDWRQRVFCNEGMWAIGYRMRVESSQGDTDDTALNSVKLVCKSPSSTTTEEIASYDGIWGDWKPTASCPGAGNYMKGARVRIEANQGSGDDTAANDVEFACMGGGTVHAPGGQAWGDWSNWAVCPNNTAVCGLSIRFEGYQGSGDDTAMNGLELECCNVAPYSPPPLSVNISRSGNMLYANASGGQPAYNYQWYYYRNCIEQARAAREPCDTWMGPYASTPPNQFGYSTTYTDRTYKVVVTDQVGGHAEAVY